MIKGLHWWTLIIGILIGMFVMPTVLGFFQARLGS